MQELGAAHPSWPMEIFHTTDVMLFINGVGWGAGASVPRVQLSFFNEFGLFSGSSQSSVKFASWAKSRSYRKPAGSMIAARELATPSVIRQ